MPNLAPANYTLSGRSANFNIQTREITSRAGEIKTGEVVFQVKPYSSGVSNWRGALILSVRNPEFFRIAKVCAGSDGACQHYRLIALRFPVARFEFSDSRSLQIVKRPQPS